MNKFFRKLVLKFKRYFNIKEEHVVMHKNTGDLLIIDLVFNTIEYSQNQKYGVAEEFRPTTYSTFEFLGRL